MHLYIFPWFSEAETISRIKNKISYVQSKLIQYGKPLQTRQVSNLWAAYKSHKSNLETSLKASGLPWPDLFIDWNNISLLTKFPFIELTHLPMLRQMSAWTQSTFSNEFTINITYREANWYSYLRTNAPTISSAVDMFAIGGLFVERDRQSNMSGINVDNNDLQSLITYQPWQGKYWQTQYLNMIKQKIVNPLQNSLGEFQKKEPRWFSENTETLGFKHMLIFDLIFEVSWQTKPNQHWNLPTKKTEFPKKYKITDDKTKQSHEIIVF